MNRLPKFGGDDGKWVYDRIMVVDCPNVIPKEQQDKQLLEKMYGISLYWGLIPRLNSQFLCVKGRHRCPA